MEAKDIISKLKFTVFKKFPFYSDLAFNREHVAIESLPFVAGTDGKRILFNKQALEKLTFDELMFIYLHELKHIMFLHNRLKKKYSDKDEMLLNIAEDILINELTREEITPSRRLLDGGQFKEKYDELKDEDVKKLSTLEIYEIIKKRFDEKIDEILNSMNNKDEQKDDKEQNEQNNEQEENKENENQEQSAIEKKIKEIKKKIKSFENELNKRDDIKDFEKEALKESYKELLLKREIEKMDEKEIEQLAKEILNDVVSGIANAKIRGFGLGNLENIVENMFRKVRDWRPILRQELNEVFKSDWTYAKINDTLQALHLAGYTQIGNLPSLANNYKLGKVLIAIDTSGSVTDEEYKDFLNEVYSIFKTVNVTNYDVLLWEWEVVKTIKGNMATTKRVLKELQKRKGYGGTRFRSVLDYIDKKRMSKVILIVLTDGEIEDDLKEREFMRVKRAIFVISEDGTTQYIKHLTKSNKIKIIKINK